MCELEAQIAAMIQQEPALCCIWKTGQKYLTGEKKMLVCPETI